jgi:hypothetical protein
LRWRDVVRRPDTGSAGRVLGCRTALGRTAGALERGDIHPEKNYPVTHRNPEMQSSIASAIHGWMLRHGLSSRDHVAAVTPLIATFACRCSPFERDQDVTDPRGYELAAMFLALFWSLDDRGVQHQAGRDMLDHVERRLAGAPDDERAVGRHPWLLALSELLDALMGTERRDVTAFVAAFADHVYAVEEEARARISTHGAAGAPGANEPGDQIDELLRLRPLLIATEPYLRLWQSLLGLWPAPSFAQTVTSLAADVRRAHPHAGLDRALDLARLAHARTPTSMVRSSPALSELEALAVVLTYLANDLGSVDRDRGADGPDQDSNLVLHLERYFITRSQVRARPCPWDEDTRPMPATEHAVTTVVAMYDTGVARLRALKRLVLAQEHDADAGRYLSLLIGIVDGNLQGMLAHSGGQAGTRAGTASANQPAPAGQESEPRYGSVATLMRLRFVDEAA